MPDPIKHAWITWENQRRSIELAKALNCDLFLFEYCGVLRYPKCIIKTIEVMIKKQYKVYFVQNPSMILAVVACLCKYVLKKKVVVDRHSTFKTKGYNKLSINYIMYTMMNLLTIKLADITIVTNEFLSCLVGQLGGSAFVLPDKIPDFPKKTARKLDGTFNILFICSYAKDEPISEVIGAMNKLKNTDIKLYVSGNHKRLDEAIIKLVPSNMIFTGYLNEDDYAEILHSVDAVMVLTTSNHTMLCGCYEAVSACKPIITSNKDVLIDYFHGSVFVENNTDDISRGILDMMHKYKQYFNNSCELKLDLLKKWNYKYDDLVKQINALSS